MSDSGEGCLKALSGMTMLDKQAQLEAIKASANVLAASLDADLFVYNFEITPPFDVMFIKKVSAREHPRPNVVLFLTTEGGSADSAFRMMRFLQAKYDHITIVVPGWCKSAGTLMCIGAHDLIMCDSGELGPLDVQITKVDEMDEQKSGLAAEAAFEKLQQEAFKFFIQFVRDFGASEYRVTLKTASDIAAKMTTGVMEPIFDKLDPVTIGEDYRSNRLALAYAERLNIHSKNLNRSRSYDALDNLLAGYESHGFVIDKKEAENLFKRVKPLAAEMVDLVDLMGMEAVFPRSRRMEQAPKMEFLNDEHEATKAAAEPGEKAAPTRSADRSSRRGNRSSGLHGNPQAGSSEEQTIGSWEIQENGG